MSNFAVARCTNGAFKIETEYSDEASARVGYHNLCAALWNEKSMDVNSKVSLLNEDLDSIVNEKIVITQPKPEEVTE
jgi:hypothetical protein